MDLIVVRDLLQSEKGRELLDFMTGFMVEISVKNNSNAEWIKGMGMLIDHLKKIDDICREKNEINRREKWNI